MYKFLKFGLFLIVTFAFLIGGYFFLRRDQWDWIIAKKEVNQLAEFDYEGPDDCKPNKIESMDLQTKFIENDGENLQLGFRLAVTIGEQETKPIKTSFAEFVVKGRTAGYPDDKILDKLAAVNDNFKDRVNLARAYKYSNDQVSIFLSRFGAALKVVEEILGYHIDLNIQLLDKDGFCLKTISYQSEKRCVFDNPNQNDRTDFIDTIIPGKGTKVIQKTIETSIDRQLAKKVKHVNFWSTIRSETKLVYIGLDEDEMKRLQEESEKENYHEEVYEENSSITE